MTEDQKDKLMDRVVEVIKDDIKNGNEEPLNELLTFVPVENLLGFLPEEEWPDYKINSLEFMTGTDFIFPPILEPWRQYIKTFDGLTIEEIMDTPMMALTASDPERALKIARSVEEIWAQIEMLFKLHKAKEIK